MSSESLRSSNKRPFLHYPHEDCKPKKLAFYALKYAKNIELDSHFVKETKSKKRYLKVFSSSKIKVCKPFEQNYSLNLLKKQKGFRFLEAMNGENAPYLAKILKTKRVDAFSFPKIYVEDSFLKTFRKSSSLRKGLTNLGVSLKNDNYEQDEKLLLQLYKCRALTSLSLFCFGPANPFRQREISYNLNLKTLESLRINVLWMGKNLLSNITTLLLSNPNMRDLSISSVEWRFSGKDRDLEEFTQALAKTKAMTGLKLSNLFLDPVYKNLLLAAISQLTNLRSLSLGMSVFNQTQYPAFENMCSELVNLNSLALELDSFYLAPEFFSSLSLLRELIELQFKVSFEESLEPCLIEIQHFFKSHPWLEKFSFIAYQTPRLEEESFGKLMNMLMWCPNLSFLDVRIRKFAKKRLNLTAFQTLNCSLSSFRELQDLTLNLHLWYPVKCNLFKLAESFADLKRMKNLVLNLPMVKGECTKTMLAFCKNIVNMKELRTLKFEFCIDEAVDLETKVFDYLLDRLQKLEELFLWYHDLGKVNNGAIVPYNHLERKARERYRLSSFILSNVLIYVYGQASEDKGKMLG